MTCEINKMASTYTLSQQLVHDLGHFIGVILKKEKLSSNAEKLRSQLHHSLQSFTVPEIEVPEQEEEYEDPEPIRVCSQLSINSVSGQSDDGSKINITLNELKKISTKQGPLWRKEKGILREVWRKYLAGIYEQKLILFYSEKDVKPTACINIQGYVARPAPDIQKDVKKKDITFELICPGKKDYQFFARTAKDMEQWVAIICQTSIQHIDISSPPRRASDHRLVISTDDSEMDDTVEEFYDDIVDSKHTRAQQASPEPAPSATSKKDNKEEIPQEEEFEGEELYNDVEEYEQPSPKPDIKPMIWHTEQRFDIKDRRSPVQVPIEPVDDEEEEEEIYHDIVEYQNKLPLKPPVVIMKPETDKPPPLPARRPLPSIPKDEPSEEEEEEENYEDITTPIQSQMKQTEENLQVSENKIREEKCEVEEFEEAYEVEDFEETYDDIGNPDSKSEVTTSQVEVDKEVEEIYDDVGDSETSPQKNDLNESAKSINNGQNNDYKTGEIRNQSKTSGVNEKEPINITINVCTKQADENNQAIKKCSVQVTKSIQNFVNNAGNAQLFLQRHCLEQKGNFAKHPTSQNEISKQTTDITDTEKTNTLQNQISKQNRNVQNITNKFNQPKNVSFLHRHSSQEEQVNVQSILQKLQSKTTGSEGNVTSQISNNPKSTTGTLQSNLSDMDSEKNTANFQNAFKKIEASLADGGKPIGGHMLKPNLPINPNKLLNQSTMSPSGESPSNSLRNIQNRPLPPKPTLSSETSEFSFNKSPASRAPEVSLESPTRSLTNSRNEYSLEPNSMLSKISVSSRESSPMPPRNKPNLSDKPKNVTMLVRTPSESSKMSPNRTKNRPNGIPVSIPNIPDLEPPKLPPRSYLK